MGFKDAMAEAKKKIKDNPDGPGFSSLPIGNYVLKLDSAKYGASPNGTNQVSILWKSMEGDTTGDGHWTNHNFDHPVGVEIFMRMLRQMGYDIDSIETEDDIKQICTELISSQPVFRATVKQAKDPQYTNTVFKEFLNFAGSQEDAGVPEEEDTKSEPEPEAEAEEAEVEDEDEEAEEEGDVSISQGTKIKYSFKNQDWEGEVDSMADGKISVITVVDGKRKRRTVPEANFIKVIQ